MGTKRPRTESSSSIDVGPDVVQQGMVTDGANDIAKALHLAQVRLGQNGRTQYQVIHLYRDGRKSLTNKNYSPTDDCNDHETDLLGTPEEKTSSEGVVPMMVVGVIFGKEPEKFKMAERESTSIMDLRADSLRVVVPLSEYIEKNFKCYVACRPVKGVYAMRVISADTVAFFPEFWNGVAEKSNQKARRKLVLQNIANARATNKHPQATASVAINGIQT